ncbi:MAG: hypothetical protein MJ077_01950 [Oscillospiraceae bacterium]|nr:hypothetical protein [Oscillospiraceae bacterium]
MLAQLIHTPAFHTLLIILGCMMLLLLVVATIILAAIALINAIVQFFVQHWRTLTNISLCIVIMGVIILLFAPV